MLMTQFFINNLPWFWLLLTIIFAVIEVFTLSLSTIWFAFGALVLTFLSFIAIPFKVQVLIFLVLSAVLLVLCRKAALNWFAKKKENTNVESLIGKTVIVTKKIEKFQKGEIKVNGVVWIAKTQDDSVLEENSECVIKSIEGVTAIVCKK